MATIIGTENHDDSTFLGQFLPGHGHYLLGNDNEDDSIYGLGGDDLMLGGSGDDYLNGGTGADIMQGGDDDDTYIIDNAGDRADEFAGGGNDEVVTFVDFTLGDFIETLTLAATAGAIDGNGNDRDNDIHGNDFDNVLDGKGGDDDIEGKDGEDTLFGGSGDDHLSGGRQNDILSGGLDNDTLDGGQGADQMFGGSGDDDYFVDSSGDVVSEFLGSGYDTVFSWTTFTLPSGVEALTLLDFTGPIDGTGNALDNALTGNGANNRLNGLDGDDVISGLGGLDTIDGGFGDDTLDGGGDTDTVSFVSWDPTGLYSPLSESVRIQLGQGNLAGTATRTSINPLVGVVESDTLFRFENVRGSNRFETIIGNSANNTLEGRGGNDVLQGNGGNDILDGGSGTDTASYESNGGRVIVTLGAGSADGNAIEFGLVAGQQVAVSVDTLRSIESVRGSAFGDQITGNEADNTIDGGGGIDTMAGLGGNDTYVVDNAADQVSEGLGQGTLDRVRTSVSYALNGSEVEVLETTNQSGTGIINLTGNSFDNTINGNNGSNIMNGAGGVDTMNGFGGNDAYIVDSSADIVNEAVGQGALDRVQTSVTYVLRAGSEIELLETVNPGGTTNLDLVGNEFDNTIVGNNGSNTIVGGLGRDTMVGNGGGDIFVWQSTAESGLAASEADIVGADFNPLLGDKLAVNPIDANELLAGDQAFTFIGQGAFTAAGQINFFTTATDTFILLNTDGDATQEMTIRVQGVHAVDASWFVL